MPRVYWNPKISTAAVLVGACFLSAVDLADAQSLDDQYLNFLSAKCTNMNFTGRAPNGNLAPGDAGPELNAFCSGIPLVGGGTPGSNATGSVSLSSRGPADDAALRRRREQLHDANAGADKQDELDVIVAGATSAYFSLNFQREEQDETFFEGGRESDSLAMTVGLDRRFGSSAVVGIAARVDDVSGNFDSGGDFESRGYGATIYLSWLPADALFVDLAASATDRSSESRRLVSFSRTLTNGGITTVIESIAPALATSEPGQKEIGGEIRSGYDWSIGSGAIGPRLAVEYRRIDIDAYTEAGNTAMTLIIDEQVEKTLRGSLGLQASKAFSRANAVWVLQGNVDWLHEFEDDQRFIRARFAQDLRVNPTRFSYQNEPPDRTAFAGRVSLSAVWRTGFSGFLAVDGLFGHEYLNRYGAALGVRKEF